MKIAIIVLRTLMGALFLFASISYLADLMPPPELTGNVKLFMEGMLATGYMMTLVKVTELVCGLAFVAGRYVALASVVIAPVVVNIFLFHLFVDTSGFAVGAFLVVALGLVAYGEREKFKPLFLAK